MAAAPGVSTLDDVATLLYYSDDPETLGATANRNGEGVLFGFDVSGPDVARFLFYHWLRDGATRIIAVRALNLSGAPAQLAWRGSVSAPSAAIINAGHHCTAGFLSVLQIGTWTTLDLTANAQSIVVSGTLDAGDLFNGICEFRVASGGPVRLSLIVANSLARVPLVASQGATFATDGRGRSGKFDIADKTPFALSYDGTAPVEQRLGERTFANERPGANGQPGIPYKGEYAVVSHMQGTLTNPTASDAVYALYQAAHGGDSTGSYVIDGTRLESGLMSASSPPPRYKLATWPIAAHSSSIVDIYTIPDNASSSPVVLTFDLDDVSVAAGSPGSIVHIDPPVSPTNLV